MRKTAAWFLTAKAPEGLLAELQRTSKAGEEEFYRLIGVAKEMGWVRLVGVASGSPADVAAVIKAQTSANIIKLDEESGG